MTTFLALFQTGDTQNAAEGWISLWDSFVNWRRNALINAFQNLKDGMNQTVNDAIRINSQSPEDFSSSAWNITQQISENVILPIAMLIFAFVFFNEIMGIVTERNNLKHYDSNELVRLGVIFILGILLIQNSSNIFNMILDIANTNITKINQIVSSNIENTEIIKNIDGIKNEINNMNLINVTVKHTEIFAITKLLNIIIWFVKVAVIARFFEIFILSSISPIPMAFFFSSELKHISFSFLKQIIAVGLHGIAILIILTIYIFLVADTPFTAENMWSNLGHMFVYSVVLVISLFKSRSLIEKAIGG